MSVAEEPRRTDAASASGLPTTILEWIEAIAGGSVTAMTRLPGGNRRQAWLLDVAGQDGVFLRYEEPDPTLDGDHYSLTREAVIYRALDGSGVAVPRFLGLHPAGHAMILARAEGISTYSKASSRQEQQAVAEDLMRHLALLHAIDPSTLEGLARDVPDTMTQAIAGEVEVWERQYRSTGAVDPLIEFGLRWLRVNLPNPSARPRIVHGDAGPGNFLFRGSKVKALIDWELYHLGDPLEDLAWLSMRTTLEPFPDFVACLDAYERETGQTIDLVRVRYHRVLVQWRVAIIRHRGHGADRANSLVSSALNRRLLVDAIADAAGVELPARAHEQGGDTALTREFDAALVMLRDEIGPAVSSSFASAKVKSVARIVKYLRDCDRLGPALADKDRHDLETLLGPIADIGRARDDLGSRIAAGDFDDRRLIMHFARQVERETRLMESAMGALAWRPFPPLERTLP